MDVLTHGEAVKLLQERSSTVDKGGAVEVVELLGALPLAVEQAAGYLSTTGVPVTDGLRAVVWWRDEPAQRYSARRSPLSGMLGVGVLPGLRLVSIRHYTESIYVGLLDAETYQFVAAQGDPLEDATSVTAAMITLVVVTVIVTALSAWRLKRLNLE